jgi:hypothetical protein
MSLERFCEVTRHPSAPQRPQPGNIVHNVMHVAEKNPDPRSAGHPINPTTRSESKMPHLHSKKPARTVPRGSPRSGSLHPRSVIQRLRRPQRRNIPEPTSENRLILLPPVDEDGSLTRGVTVHFYPGGPLLWPVVCPGQIDNYHRCQV